MVGGELCSSGVEYQIPMSMLVELFQTCTKPPMVKTMNKETGKVEWKELEGAMLTRENTELIEIETECGQVLRCTPDHEIWTKNRGYVKAKDLLDTDELVINPR
jgi:intein/homing endonuclease